MPDTPEEPVIDAPSLLRRKRYLPHWQLGGSTYFITFRSARGTLPPEARRVVLERVEAGHSSFYTLLFGVVMPDHVHLLLSPLKDQNGDWRDLAKIMQWIKGGSSRTINQILQTSGPVWSKESFDRIVRDETELEQKWNYMIEHPRRAGRVERPEDYEYFTRVQIRDVNPD